MSNKITPAQVHTEHVMSLTGAILSASAGRKVNLSTLGKKVTGSTTLVDLLAKVSNEHRREILRREYNNSIGLGVQNKSAKAAPVKAAKSTKTTRQRAKAPVVKSDSSEWFAAGQVAYPEHPRAGGRKTARAMHLGLTLDDAIVAAGLYIWDFLVSGEWAKDSVFVTLCEELQAVSA